MSKNSLIAERATDVYDLLLEVQSNFAQAYSNLEIAEKIMQDLPYASEVPNQLHSNVLSGLIDLDEKVEDIIGLTKNLVLE